MIENKTSGIFIRITKNSNDYIDKIINESVIIKDFKSRGYSIDKSVLSRFGLLCVCENLAILQKHPDLLLSASKTKSTEESLSIFESKTVKEIIC